MTEGRKEEGMGKVRWYDISACGVRVGILGTDIDESKKEKGESIRQQGDNDESCRLAEG